MRAVFKYNFKSDLTGWQHAPRAFAGAKDKGLIICTWPKGGRPGHVMLYSDEVWTGIEYQVAAHMIYEGLIEEGFAIVKAARDRYDGIPRPPIERNPGTRSSAAATTPAPCPPGRCCWRSSGCEYDGPRQALRFTPRHTPENFKSFFAGPEGWGSLSQTRTAQEQRSEVSVSEGRLRMAELTLKAGAAPNTVKAETGGTPVETTFAMKSGEVVISFKKPVTLNAGQSLVVQLA